MGKQFIFNVKIISGSVMVAFVSTPALADQPLGDVRLGEYVIPGMFGQALQQGLTVPVYLRLVGGNPDERQKVADAAIALQEGRLLIQEVVLHQDPKGAVLSSETEAMILGIEARYFDNSTHIKLSDDAALNLSIKSFVLTLDVNEEALSTAVIPRQFTLAKSSVDSLSAVLSYDLGVYQTRVRNGVNSNNNYVNIRNTIGYKEHHFSLDGSVYGVGKGAEQSSEIYRALYERDVNGNRLALGMFDTWNLQSIASLSALNASKVYGATMGNQSSTKIKSNQYSLTPITIFMPAAGEAHVYRNGRLLSIENFPMGSFEIDTGRLPFGIYDVDIEVMIDGEVRSRTTHRINKAFSNSNADMNEVSWEVYGGYVDYDRKVERLTGGTKETYLLGVSAAVNLPVLSGLSIQTSSYIFDSHFVNETALSLAVLDYGSVGWQGLISEKGRYRNIVNATAVIPKGYGSVWASKEKSNIKGDLGIYDSDVYSFGGTLNVNQFIDKGGSLTFSRTVDKRVNTRSNNFEYATSLYSGRRGTMNLRAGVQRYQYGNDVPTDNRKYISLGFSVPLSNWVNVGLSSDNGDVNLDLSGSKTFEDGPISAIGINTAKQLRDRTGRNSDFSTNGYAMFDTKYSSGTVSLSRPDSQRLSGHLTAGGSVGLGAGKVVPSGKREDAGVIIQTDMTGGASLSAQINGRHYRLTGKNNFIPLAPYAEYKVELMNDKNSMDSVNIVKGKTQNVTLYPGNVAVYRPEVKQLVTVFGRLTTAQGEALAYTEIKNHIGKTMTDKSGAFAMDVDKRYPTISLVGERQKCDVELDLTKAQGVLWVGDLDCRTGAQLAKTNVMPRREAALPVPTLEQPQIGTPMAVVPPLTLSSLADEAVAPRPQSLAWRASTNERLIVPTIPHELSPSAPESDPRRYVPRALAPADVSAAQAVPVIFDVPVVEGLASGLDELFEHAYGYEQASQSGMSQPYAQLKQAGQAYLSEEIKLTTVFSDIERRQDAACEVMLGLDQPQVEEWVSQVACQSHININVAAK